MLGGGLAVTRYWVGDVVVARSTAPDGDDAGGTGAVRLRLALSTSARGA